jgi:hypothetical protein
MEDFNKHLHEHALTQAQQHGKRILPADSDKDSLYVSVGAVIGAIATIYVAHRLHLHGQILSLFISAIGLAIGGVSGYSVYDYFFVKDESWQPPVMNSRR